MAASTRILSLNLGTQTVGLAEFHTQPHGGLVLNSYRLREILADPSGEVSRAPQIAAALREMMAELKLKQSRVNYAVSGQSVFARFVKLPSIDEAKVEQIIQFEAQQNVPFPIEEVVWDYQLVASGGDDKVEVVLVAIKSDLLDDVNGAVEEAGLRPTIVDVAPMALYNAFRYNYSELTGCSLLVDIGARTTNLIFVESGRVFSRSIPIGGSTISGAIAKEFNEPVGAAEARKKRDAYVSLGGSYADASDPDVARVSKIVRNTMTRLHAEITRSISFYRAQQQGGAPQRVYLCGGTSSMPYMREFFVEKLQLPIEYFNPLRNVTVANTVVVDEIAKVAHTLGELVGLSLRKATTCPMELNLRPASVIRQQKLEQRRPFFILAGVCLLLGLLGWSFYYRHTAEVQQAVTEQLQRKVDAMSGVQARIDKLNRQMKDLDALAEPLNAAIDDRSFWPEVLEDLNQRLPKENIWITELVPTSGGKPIGPGTHSATETGGGAQVSSGGENVTSGSVIDGLFIHGLYLFNPKQQEVVVDYFRNLISSPFFNIDPNNQAQTIKPQTPTTTDWAFPYELRLKLRQPRKVP